MSRISKADAISMLYSLQTNEDAAKSYREEAESDREGLRAYFRSASERSLPAFFKEIGKHAANLPGTDEEAQAAYRRACSDAQKAFRAAKPGKAVSNKGIVSEVKARQRAVSPSKVLSEAETLLKHVSASVDALEDDHRKALRAAAEALLKALS